MAASVAKHTGDGLAATFDGATHAILAALASTAVACRYECPELRCGLHTGEIERTPHDIGGLAVHIAQRISRLRAALRRADVTNHR